MKLLTTMRRRRAEARRGTAQGPAKVGETLLKAPPPLAARKRAGGFTLIEAILVIALLAVGMTGVFYLTAVGTDMNINTREEMLAYQAANEYMDYLRQQPFTALTAVGPTRFGETAGSVGYQALSGLSNSWGQYEIIDKETVNNDTVKQLTVTVKLSRKKSARNREVTVSTMASKGGLNERWQTEF